MSHTRMTSAPELVVLLDEAGRAVGTAEKATVHDADTRLHLAFSCYLVDDDGRLLMTQRASSKRTFPGVWTNSCCGHPGPGESMADAVRRRVQQELGVDALDVRLLLPGFRYRAVAADGTVENELCPVFVARCPDPEDLHPDPAEVDDVAWVPWPELRDDVLTGRRDVSLWCAEQVAALPADLAGAPAADDASLPPAAR